MQNPIQPTPLHHAALIERVVDKARPRWNESAIGLACTLVTHSYLRLIEAGMLSCQSTILYLQMPVMAEQFGIVAPVIVSRSEPALYHSQAYIDWLVYWTTAWDQSGDEIVDLNMNRMMKQGKVPKLKVPRDFQVPQNEDVNKLRRLMRSIPDARCPSHRKDV